MRPLAVVSVALWLVWGAPARGLDDAKWLHPGADRLSALTRLPSECLEKPETAERAYIVALGRLAFRAPGLLGGLAARTGMRCQTCHRNGHDNPDFYLDGVSDSPGTADVTSNIFSHSRGDDIFNPVAIPTLLDSYAKSSYGTRVPFKRLQDFITEAIVAEFQGRLPPRQIIAGLLAYVTALRRSACPAPGWAEASFETDVDELTGTYQVLMKSVTRGDPEVAVFALAALRAALGRFAQRFVITGAPVSELARLSQYLERTRPLLATNTVEATRNLTVWRARLDQLIGRFRPFSGDSLYNEKRLRVYLRPVP